MLQLASDHPYMAFILLAMLISSVSITIGGSSRRRSRESDRDDLD